MAALTLQVVPHAGVTPTLTTGLGGGTGHTAPCGDGIALMLVNGTSSACVITVHVPAAITFDGLVIPNRAFSLPATSGSVSFIPLVQATYADPTTGLVTFDCAAGTVSGAVVAIGS